MRTNITKRMHTCLAEVETLLKSCGLNKLLSKSRFPSKQKLGGNRLSIEGVYYDTKNNKLMYEEYHDDDYRNRRKDYNVWWKDADDIIVAKTIIKFKDFMKKIEDALNNMSIRHTTSVENLKKKLLYGIFKLKHMDVPDIIIVRVCRECSWCNCVGEDPESLEPSDPHRSWYCDKFPESDMHYITRQGDCFCRTCDAANDLAIQKWCPLTKNQEPFVVMTRWGNHKSKFEYLRDKV